MKRLVAFLLLASVAIAANLNPVLDPRANPFYEYYDNYIYHYVYDTLGLAHPYWETPDDSSYTVDDVEGDTTWYYHYPPDTLDGNWHAELTTAEKNKYFIVGMPVVMDSVDVDKWHAGFYRGRLLPHIAVYLDYIGIKARRK